MRLLVAGLCALVLAPLAGCGFDDEPDADSEPSLGWTLGGLTASGNDHHNLDCKADEAEHGYELPPPLKAWSAWAGRSQRRERL